MKLSESSSDHFKYPVHSVQYAFLLIEILSKGKKNYSLTDLVRLSSLSKGVVYRLLGTLRFLGYITYHSKSRKYSLTYKFFQIGETINDRIHVTDITPSMERLASEYQEMVNLAVLEQAQIVYLHSIESPHALKLDFQVGSYQPAYCTALGRVLLAYQDQDDWE